MNNINLPLLTLGFLLAATSVASDQCRKFTRDRVISTLSADQAIDQITAGTLGRGESAAALIEVETAGKMDLIISTHPDLGEVSYNVVNSMGGNIASGNIRGSVARLPVEVEADQDLIVLIKSETGTSAYTPLGCVSLATVRDIPNEMDILTDY